MNFDLTEEQQLVQKTARDFARREIEPVAAELDRTARWPSEIVARLGELGFLGMAVPVEHGGAGLSQVSYALVVEEISAACASSGVIMSVNNSLFCDPLLRFGTELQKREILAPAAAGKRLGCFGLTEPSYPDGGRPHAPGPDGGRPHAPGPDGGRPHAPGPDGGRPHAPGGPDARTMLTVAEKQGDTSFILNGSKNFIIVGPEAEHVIVFAVTTPDPERPRHTALVVRRGSPGYVLAPHDEKMGIEAAHSCTIFFENVRVPASHLLGEEGQGLAVAMATLDGGRIGIAAQAVGIARAAFDEATAYAKERTPIAGLQAIQFMLSDMAVDIDAARLLTLRAARMKDEGRRHTAESSMAKLFASEMATRVTHKALQIFGGYGYTTEYGVERHYRDARITEIYQGTSEIQRMVIANSVLEG